MTCTNMFGAIFWGEYSENETQDQQFTLILQTLQQLRDVYGDSVDKIVQGNTSNIIFLKSTDCDTVQWSKCGVA